MSVRNTSLNSIGWDQLPGDVQVKVGSPRRWRALDQQTKDLFRTHSKLALRVMDTRVKMTKGLNERQEVSARSKLEAARDAAKKELELVEQERAGKREVALTTRQLHETLGSNPETRDLTRLTTAAQRRTLKSAADLKREEEALKKLIEMAEGGLSKLPKTWTVSPSLVCNKWSAAILTLITLGGIYFFGSPFTT